MTESRYFIACHDFMIHDLKLKGFSLLIYALLYNYYTVFDETCLSVDLIMSKTGCSRRQVYSVVNDLVSKRLVLGVQYEFVHINQVRAETAQVRAETAHIGIITNNVVSTYLEETLEEYEERNKNLIKKD